MKEQGTLTVQRRELEIILEAMLTADSELTQFEIDSEWFVADSRDRLYEATQLVKDLLGIQEYEYDEEVKQHDLELRFDED